MPLFVVATPIGNLDDLSPRAAKALGEADVVYAEDTRHSQRLMQHIGANTPLQAFHDHSDEARIDELIARVEQGDNVALVSDAGTPGVSDPGYRVIRRARERGLAVFAIPGPSALTAFMSASGLASDEVRFVGFPPRKAKARLEALSTWMATSATSVMYESPKRVVGLLDTVVEVDPARTVCVAREITKLHEEWLYGAASQVRDALAARDRVRGEIVVGVEGASRAEQSDDLDARAWVTALAATSISTKDLSRVVAARTGCSAQDAYRWALEARDADG